MKRFVQYLPDESKFVLVNNLNFKTPEGRVVSDVSLLDAEGRRELNVYQLISNPAPQGKEYERMKFVGYESNNSDMTATEKYLAAVMPLRQMKSKLKEKVNHTQSLILSKGVKWPGEVYDADGVLVETEAAGVKLDINDRTEIMLYGNSIADGSMEPRLYEIKNGLFVKISSKEDADKLAGLGFAYETSIRDQINVIHKYIDNLTDGEISAKELCQYVNLQLSTLEKNSYASEV